jgi:hypothetical protein
MFVLDGGPVIVFHVFIRFVTYIFPSVSKKACLLPTTIGASSEPKTLARAQSHPRHHHHHQEYKSSLLISISPL